MFKILDFLESPLPFLKKNICFKHLPFVAIIMLRNIMFVGIDVETGRRVIEGTGSPDITAHSIHRALYRHRLNVKSVMHTHPTYATVLSVLQVKLFCFCLLLATILLNLVVRKLIHIGLCRKCLLGAYLGHILCLW